MDAGTVADWTPEQVVARQERLADWALSRWSVDFHGFEADDDIDFADAADEAN